MKRLYIFIILVSLFVPSLFPQAIEQSVGERLTEFFQQYTTAYLTLPPCKMEKFEIDHRKKRLDIYAGDPFGYQPFRPETTKAIYERLEEILPGPVRFYDITIYVGGKTIDELIPNIYRDRKKDKTRLYTAIKNRETPWVSNVSLPYKINRGLAGHHIALWQSHGRYYKNDKKEWTWQRPYLFNTTEDQLTQSFIIPYIIPMLENAGANVFTPRERDVQRNEAVVDNDMRSASLYVEVGSRNSRWETAGKPGFAQKTTTYTDGENPFIAGTARFAATEKKAHKAFAQWIPTIPASGAYAVYVSYQTLANSVSDAKYKVFHKGGVTDFTVNQKIGGGTWVYLGTFEFDKGRNDYGMVALSNESKEKGVVCADGVRFGGGMGNIARGGAVSRLPRYLEGARYSAQWAGMPYEVYAPKQGDSDYNDDILVRGNAVNYLSGGSAFNPKEAGLGVPIEMSLGLHTDAGIDPDNRIYGTLGIYTTGHNNGKLYSGASRFASRDLSDIMLTQLQKDIRSTFSIQWTRRGLWDRNYGETRVPGVASMILELLSHQNAADMQMAHDPNFKFTASRSIYKAILRFLGEQNGEAWDVQPLPVSHFAIDFGTKKNRVELSWRPEEDPLEPSASPRNYVVYTRIGNSGFDNGVTVSSPSYSAKLEPGLIYSFKVTAVNRGGESFPSEILTAYKAPKERSRVLIVNGFNRIGGPVGTDPGVPYLYDISFSDRKIAGNAFDYPFIHGKAIEAAGGHSFVSCSAAAVENQRIRLEDYRVVDLIMGLQKDDRYSNPARNIYYKTFTPALQRAITNFCKAGGKIMVSGSYIGSDMYASQADRSFTENVLKYTFQGTVGTGGSGQVFGLGRTLTIPRLQNEQIYPVTAPDCIGAVAPAFPVFLYLPKNYSAGIAYKGTDYRTFVMGFPFECIESEAERGNVMKAVLGFFE